MEVEKLEEHFEMVLPEGDYESVGGFIINVLEKIPEAGEIVRHKNLEFRIESADKRKIDSVRIRRNALSDHSDEDNRH
jgi:CBS domain containing-hemolysin-like protein